MSEAFVTEVALNGKTEQTLVYFDLWPRKSQNKLKAWDKILQIYAVSILYGLATPGKQNDIQNK